MAIMYQCGDCEELYSLEVEADSCCEEILDDEVNYWEQLEIEDVDGFSTA